MAEMTDIRVQVRARLAQLERPRLVAPGALVAWADSLPPARYAAVAQLLLGGRARRWITKNRPELLAEAEAWGVGRA